MLAVLADNAVGTVGEYSRIQLRPASNYGGVPRRLMEEDV